MFILQTVPSQVKSLKRENFSQKTPKKSSVLITHSQIQTDDYPNKKSTNLNRFVPYLLSLFPLSSAPYCWGQMNIDSCSCLMLRSEPNTREITREPSEEKGEKTTTKHQTDFNLVTNFQFFFTLILAFFLLVLSIFTPILGKREILPFTEPFVLDLRNLSCLWKLYLFHLFSLLLTTTKENLFSHLDYRRLHWSSIIHMSWRKWGVEDSTLIWGIKKRQWQGLTNR